MTIDKSVEFPMDSQENPLSQDLVLVASGSPKRSTKITARTENLLAIHRKILLHLRNEKPLMKFELHKLLSILKRIDCSSPRDQKVAHSAHEILIKCIYSQSAKEEETRPQNTTLSSSTTNETQTSESTSDDSDAKRHQYDVESETPPKTDNLGHQFTQNELHHTESESDQHFLSPTDLEIRTHLYNVRSESPYYESNNLNNRYTGNATTCHQAEVEQHLNQKSILHDKSENQQRLFNVRSETLYTPDDHQYRFNKNASTSHQTESELQLNVASASNIFSNQTTQDNEQQSFVKEMTVVPNNNEDTLLTTNMVLSQTFLRRHLSVSSNIDVDEIDNDKFEIYDRTDNDKYDNEKSSNVPFTVPTMIEKKDYSTFSQSTNVLKLRLADVQFDSDTVSIPMELLTNLNFGSGEKQSQEVTGRGIQSVQEKISHNNVFSFKHAEQNTPNRDTSTLISNFTEVNDTMDINTSLNNENIQSYGQTKQGYSFKHSNNIESKRNTLNSTFTSDKKHGRNISCTTTSNSTTDQQAISSYSTNREKSILNIEMEETNSKNSPTSKGAMDMTGEGKSNKEKPNVLLTIPNVRHSSYISRKNTLNGTVTNITTGNFDNAWNVPRNNDIHSENAAVLDVDNVSFRSSKNTLVANNDNMFNDVKRNINTEGNFYNAWYVPENNKLHFENALVPDGNVKNIDNDPFSIRKPVETNVHTGGNFDKAWVIPFKNIPDDTNRNVGSETSDLENSRLDPTTDAMEICKSWMDEQENIVEMTEAEKRYLEMALDSTESETNDFIADQNKNKINKVEHRAHVDETNEGSFVFNLDTNNYYSSDIIEATPCDNLEEKSLNKKIKTLLPKKPKSQLATRNPLIISETEDIIIDETPFDTNSETPNIIIDETLCGISEPSGKHQYNNSVSQSAEVQCRVQTPKCKQHALFNPYKKRPRSSNFQEMYKSNYQRKLSKTVSGNSKINILGNITVSKGNLTQSQSFGVFTSEDKNTEKTAEKVALLDMSDSLSLKQFTNITLATPPSFPNDKSDEKEPKHLQPVESENIVLIDGTHPTNPEQMDTTHTELEEKESFEETTRKLREKIIHKRNKYRDTWNEKPVNEKVSLKYVRKFGVNIFEDPVNSLLNIGYNVNVNNFHFPRLTLVEMKEKLHKSSQKAILLNEALTKMVDLQISSANKEDYKLNMGKDVTRDLDSDDSSDDEETKRKKQLEEIRFMSRLELKKFKEEMEKERKEEIRLNRDKILAENNDGDEEETVTNGKEETSNFIRQLRQAVDCSWLK